jgi:hypothetical protein
MRNKAGVGSPFPLTEWASRDAPPPAPADPPPDMRGGGAIEVVVSCVPRSFHYGNDRMLSSPSLFE